MDVLLENNKQVIRKFLRIYKDFREGEPIEGKHLTDMLRNTAEILLFISKINTSEDEILKGREQCLEMVQMEIKNCDPENSEDLPEQLEMFLQAYRELLGGKYKSVKAFP